jgi:hypothetical protein
LSSSTSVPLGIYAGRAISLSYNATSASKRYGLRCFRKRADLAKNGVCRCRFVFALLVLAHVSTLWRRRKTSNGHGVAWTLAILECRRGHAVLGRHVVRVLAERRLFSDASLPYQASEHVCFRVRALASLPGLLYPSTVLQVTEFPNPLHMGVPGEENPGVDPTPQRSGPRVSPLTRSRHNRPASGRELCPPSTFPTPAGNETIGRAACDDYGAVPRRTLGLGRSRPFRAFIGPTRKNPCQDGIVRGAGQDQA